MSLPLWCTLLQVALAPAEGPAEAPEWDGDDLDGDWLAGYEDGEESSVEDAASGETGFDAPLPRPDIATGALRLTGGYLHLPDVPELYPEGDDAIGTSVLRLMVDQDVNEHVEYEINIFGDLSRSPAALSQGGMFASAGSATSAYRSPHLSFPFWENGSVRGSAGIDRFALRVHEGRFSLAVGRFPLNYSVTNIFTPNDFYSPFSATAINRIYKPGIDGVNLGIGIGALSGIDVASTMGYDDSGDPDWGRASLMTRAYAVKWGVEWAAMGGKIAERWFAGASLQGDVVGPLGFRAESHLGLPDEDGDGTLDEDRDPYVRVAGGPSLTFSWQNTFVAAEYGFYMDGAEEPEDYLGRATEFYPDDIPYLGQHYVGWALGMQAIPILTLNTIGLVNVADGSGLAGGFLSYSISDEADFIGGVYAPWGEGPSFDGFPIAPPVLGSEFGLGGLSVFLETRFFF